MRLSKKSQHTALQCNTVQHTQHTQPSHEKKFSSSFSYFLSMFGIYKLPYSKSIWYIHIYCCFSITLQHATTHLTHPTHPTLSWENASQDKHLQHTALHYNTPITLQHATTHPTHQTLSWENAPQEKHLQNTTLHCNTPITLQHTTHPTHPTLSWENAPQEKHLQHTALHCNTPITLQHATTHPTPPWENAPQEKHSGMTIVCTLLFYK